MVSGLLTVASQTDLLWVCAALSDADRAAARAAPQGRLELDGQDGRRRSSAVLMLDIPADTFAAAYNAVANSTLWFVHHMLYELPRQPSFGPQFAAEWEQFRDYNRAFATALARARADGSAGARAVVQDYHLSLVPRMLADRRPDLRIAHFSHTPWAPPDYYRVLPDQVAREVLEGILGADHAGFLCQRWADAFADCCEAILGAEVDRARQRISYRGHVTGIGVHALGVDAAELTGRAAEPDVAQRLAELTELAGGRKLIVRIDRTELSKNIVRGLAAYRELLVTRPEWHGPGDAPGLRLPVPDRPGRVPRVHRGGAAAGRADRGRVRHAGLDAAGGAGGRRLRPLAGRLPGGRRPAGQPDQGRDEPGGQGGPDRLRPRLRARAVP